MSTTRLDNHLVERGLAATRSQAENHIKLGKVTVNGKVVLKPGFKMSKNAIVELTAPIRYVSRGGLKLESVATQLKLDFQGKTVLDVGSSTGGFSDYALQHGAAKIIAIDVGKNQMDQRLKTDQRIELHEQTDIRDVKNLSTKIDYCLIDVSFISVRLVLGHLLSLIDYDVEVIAMVKPQFETTDSLHKHKGVIKNENIRRKVLKAFEGWAKPYYKIIDKSDSLVPGPKGNLERFYLLKPVR
ncbi:MAG TPA: TlyA family RNA methyltransferase [Candidatus Saccharimonadales bacterium]|nr:TlyA family RNA methyltransferase [Candidatus Saccharimonadales bacterium]